MIGMPSVEPKMIGRRYVLRDSLGTGGMGAVYLATDRLTGGSVALKRVIQPDEQPDSASTGNSQDYRLALAGEFKVLASLRHPNIISVLDYGFDEERHPYYTMELVDNAKTILEAGDDRPPADQVNLLVQMLQALAYLHRRGIIHRDLKPRNVLVTNGQVKVLDFGLSIASGGDEGASGTAGTLAYMAPEILTGGTPSESADLYAVGIMAYELFTGRHPYTTDDIASLLNSILYDTPDMALLDSNPRFAMVVGRLLAKMREDRYPGARQVIADLSDAVDQPIPLETAATRESFLQAARLVGRDAEIKRLSDALGDAIDGQGSAWLIGGESGVGKSRFVDELRALALVRGALVLRGYSVSEGGSPYFLWRPAVRWLALLTEMDDKDLSVLKTIIPDINALLGREIPDVDESDAKATQNRLLEVIEKLFRDQKTPTLLILEDLHWSKESLDVLARLNKIVDGLPLLIVGSYRDDERPELPSKLPGMNVLRLERLSESGIAELSEAMLGEQGRQPEVIDLLQRETEGNVFFLVEVVRALAEEAGTLERIGMATLPAQVFAGGVQQIIARRLAQVPPEAHPLLRAAAVLGRQLDLDILREIDSYHDIDQWLTICSDAAVLEVQEGEWRFAHDKLRDGALAELSADARRGLHGKIAAAMETRYQDSPERLQSLAFHYASAGNTAKEAYYTALAGQQCLRSGAYRDSITFFMRTLHLTTEAAPGEMAALRIKQVDLKRQIAQAHLGLGEYGKARVLYMENLGTCIDIPYRKGTAEALMSLGDVASALAEFEEANKQYQEALDIYRELGEPEGVARALNSLGNVAYETGRVDEAKKLFQESLTLSRVSGGQWGMAGAMSQGGGGGAEYTRAKNDLRDALTAYAAALKDPASREPLIRAFQKLANITDSTGEHAATTTLLNEELAYFKQSGDAWGEAAVLGYLGRVACAAGDYAAAESQLNSALELASETAENVLALDVLVAFSRLLIARDQKEKAVELLGLSLHHPDSSEETEDEAEGLLFELEDSLDPKVMAANWEKGKTRPLEDALKELLAKTKPA
jgi:eukaryotic-like serine/threonine-protein kinase